MSSRESSRIARKPLYRRLGFVLPVIFGAVLFLPSASVYYRYSGGRSCASCHEIWQPYSDCHGDVLTLDAGFHLKNIRQLFAHIRGQVPEQVRLKPDDVQQVNARCAKCHRQEYADWAAGPHAITYKEIFLDESHNRKVHLADDCLRCHGMHYAGGIRDLVTTNDTKGPWRLQDAKLTRQPTVPCLACHQMHRQGNVLARPTVKSIEPGPN